MTEARNRDDYRANSITIPMTEKEKAIIKAAAKSIGMTTSTYVRFHILEIAKEDLKNVD